MNIYDEILSKTDRYNLHSHTQFCDGHASMRQMAEAASQAGMLHYGFSPHSPICVDSPCNMKSSDVAAYLEEKQRLSDDSSILPKLYAAMEIDFISPDFGPHIDYFQNIPLDYRIGSVHFVPNQDGISIDCDGSPQRFLRNLKEGFQNDLRYVVETYFVQLLTMIERGGFDILGHLDKIAQNAVEVDPEIESNPWYEALIDDAIRLSADRGIIVEINTKYINEKGRFFPHERWWNKLAQSGAHIAVNSDAHWPDKINEGRRQAFELLNNLSLSPNKTL